MKRVGIDCYEVSAKFLIRKDTEEHNGRTLEETKQLVADFLLDKIFGQGVDIEGELEVDVQ